LDAQYFNQGETPETFVASLGENRAKFEKLLEESVISEEQVSHLPRDLKVVVIAEPWSGDVLYNLPPLIQIAQATGWEVRIFRRDSYPDLILPYRKDGLYHSIPVIVFFDWEFKEVAYWIERPASATQMIDDESLKLRRHLREENKDEWRKETVKEIITILE